MNESQLCCGRLAAVHTANNTTNNNNQQPQNRNNKFKAATATAATTKQPATTAAATATMLGRGLPSARARSLAFGRPFGTFTGVTRHVRAGVGQALGLGPDSACSRPVPQPRPSLLAAPPRPTAYHAERVRRATRQRGSEEGSGWVTGLVVLVLFWDPSLLFFGPTL